MFCNKCGNQLADNAKFCTKCGNQINSKNQEADNQEVSSQPEQDGFAPQTTQADQTAVMPQSQQNPQDSFQQPVNNPDTTAVQPPVSPAQPGYQAQGSAQVQPQPNKNNNVALYVVIGVLITVIIAAVLVIFLVIKPFDKQETTTVATHVTEDSSSNDNNKNKSNNNNNSSSTTKSVSCTAANGSTLSGTVRLKNGYVIPDSSSKSYSASEIAALGLNDAELCIAWNEPYARAGYHFKNSGLQQYFNSCSWYHDTGFSGTLSDTGGQNTNVIKGVAGSSAWKNLATY